MHSMAIDTRWNIRITFSDKGCPVDAVLVEVIDLGVAFLACLRDACARLGGWLYIVGPVAVGAHCSIGITGGQGLLMDAVQCRLVLVLVASGAGGVLLQGEVPPRPGRHLRMRKAADVGMALHAGVALLTVDRAIVGCPVNGQVKLLAGRKIRRQPGGAVAGKAGLV